MVRTKILAFQAFSFSYFRSIVAPRRRYSENRTAMGNHYSINGGVLPTAMAPTRIYVFPAVKVQQGVAEPSLHFAFWSGALASACHHSRTSRYRYLSSRAIQ